MSHNQVLHFLKKGIFNIEARISEYRIFNSSLLDEQVVDLYNGNNGKIWNNEKCAKIYLNIRKKSSFVGQASYNSSEATQN